MDKRIEKLLTHPDKLTLSSHIQIPKALKWDVLLMAAAKETRDNGLSEELRDALEKAVASFKKNNKPAYDAMVKRWGPWDAPTHGRKAR